MPTYSHQYINVGSDCLSVCLSVTDVTHHDAFSFPRFELLCQRHTRASNIPVRATRTQHFGSSHLDQLELKRTTAPASYLRAR